MVQVKKYVKGKNMHKKAAIKAPPKGKAIKSKLLKKGQLK
jgi:hypothetical protein